MITPDLALEIKNSGKDVITLGHAYRVNGVVDIWFNGKTLFKIKENRYEKFKSPRELIKNALLFVDSTSKAEPFKKLKTGRISYKEFTNKRIESHAEYYAWQNDISTSETFLYFIKAGSYVKIGRSLDPQKRLIGLKTGIPEKPKLILIVPKKGHLERLLHKAFSEERQNGEWFFYSDRIKKFILYVKGHYRN